jgi:hypothetical protein
MASVCCGAVRVYTSYSLILNVRAAEHAAAAALESFDEPGVLVR